MVVDVQDRLIDTIVDHEPMIQNIKGLINAAKVLQLPILATEQEKLGDTVSELKVLLPEASIRKLTFSCCDSAEFMTKLKSMSRKSVIICGIETHICVMQTVLDLLVGHHRILVVKDATSSHAVVDREAALRRMEAAGAEIVTSEAIIYELTEKAGTDEFRRILDIIKDRRTLGKQAPHRRARQYLGFEALVNLKLGLKELTPRQRVFRAELSPTLWISSRNM